MAAFFRIAFTMFGSLLLIACSDSTAAPQEESEQQQLPRVLVVTTAPDTVVLSRAYAARTQGSKEVDIRARIEGELQSRDYQEGQLVEKGDLLFTIEDAPYRVDLERAEAELQRATADLNDAQRQWDRIRSLFEEGAVSQRERDQGKANLELAEANKAAAEASTREAEINLSYTEVRSPITGVAGRESYSVGNLVSSGDMLTNVIQLDPLYVYFSVPEGDLAATYLLQQVGVTTNPEGDTKPPSARIELPTGQVYDETGYIDFVGRQVDSQTGTLASRASIPNPNAVVLPGQFTRVQIPDIRIPNAITIPERAIVQSGESSMVYVVNADGKTERREVILGPRSDEGLVIQAGLSADETVVVEGLANIQEGIEVNTAPFDENETNGATATAEEDEREQSEADDEDESDD